MQIGLSAQGLASTSGSTDGATAGTCTPSTTDLRCGWRYSLACFFSFGQRRAPHRAPPAAAAGRSERQGQTVTLSGVVACVLRTRAGVDSVVSIYSQRDVPDF